MATSYHKFDLQKIILVYLLSTIPYFLQAQLVKGINLVGPFDNEQHDEALNKISDLHANWVGILPEVTLNRKSIELETHPNDNWTLSELDYRALIKQSQKAKLKVLLKPHLVLGKRQKEDDKLEPSSDWRGNIEFCASDDWQTFEDNYSAYIIKWAAIAEEENVDAFIIGTELKSLIEYNTKFWEKLIDEVRTIYSGPISYSANWDNYHNIKFWDKLNFIGVNGYFPISEEEIVTPKVINNSWDRITKELEHLSMQTKKKILITEFGYRNIKSAGNEPWLHVSQTLGRERDDDNQYKLIEAYFENLWKQDYILGGVLWNWTQTGLRDGNTDFSIEGKPAEELVREKFIENR